VTWFKVDDQFPMHRKALAAGPDGRHLWYITGTLCAASNVGIAEPPTLQMAGFMTGVDVDQAAALLVGAGLWHDAKALNRCPPCKERVGRLPAGAYYFHDWHEHQLSQREAKDSLQRFRWARAKELKRDWKLLHEVRRRDGGHCRYCDVLVDFDNPELRDGASHDHVDPLGPNTLDNVVLACRRCNGNKKNRTPEDAGMPLLPPRGPRGDSADMSADSPRTTDNPSADTSADPSRARARRDGSADGPRTVRGRGGSKRAGQQRADEGRDGPQPGEGSDRPDTTSDNDQGDQ
jgi:5-methylcytosine-specific restriction endonuclease McrA